MTPLTEQQIDAELSEYAPMNYGDEWVWWDDMGGRHHDVGDIPSETFRQLVNGLQERSRWARHYPTREAAFADLRHAIRAARELTSAAG